MTLVETARPFNAGRQTLTPKRSGSATLTKPIKTRREGSLKRKPFLFAAAMAAATLLYAAGLAAAAETVKVGITWPLTGNAGAAGQASKAAAELVAEIVNNEHPELGDLPLAKTAGLPNLGGAKIELIFTDHQGNPSLAQQLTTRLITQDKVHVMLGAYQSSCSFTATAVAERYGIPFMVGESAALNITGRGFKWVFRGTPIASDYARTYMRFFADMKKAGKKIDSIAIVNENTDYGTSVAESITEEAKKANIAVAIRIPYSASSTDVSAQVLQLKEKNPDVVIFISYTADSILYMKTMKNLDYKPPMVIGDDSGFSDPSFVPAVFDVAQGAMNRSAWDGRQARVGHLQDQRDVQGQDRSRSRRHQRAQHAELLCAPGCDQPRRFHRSGEDPYRVDANRSQARAADDGIPGGQIR